MISGRLELDHTYERKERPIAIKLLNRFISSPLSVLMLAALTCYAFAFSKEFEFYLFVIIYGTYVGLFCDDLSPLMPLFVFCYITPSVSNNPGTSSESLFYGTKGVILLVSVLVAVALIFIRIFRDENMGFRRLFFMRRFLLFGILILGASYMLSGILWEGYGELAKQNLVFAALQFLSIFLLYFVFSATVDWENFNVNYFVWIGIALGFIISFEIFWIYTNNEVIVNGSIDRDAIKTGWGIYNNIGAMVTMAIPFPFYFAATKRFATPWILVGVLFLVFSVLSCSRTGAFCGLIAFGLSYLMLLRRARSKIEVYFVTVLGIAAAVVLAFVFRDKLAELFEDIPGLFKDVDGEKVFTSMQRVELYKTGIESAGIEPIFGITFYPTTFDIVETATLETFKSFFPGRWHNTIIQMLVSCGIVGIVSYAIHRISTVALYFKRRENLVNTPIAISIISLLLMSLLDCHFFNIGPTLFYSTMLAVMEFGEE